MNSNTIYYYGNPNYLCHYGRKGMRWGEHIYGKQYEYIQKQEGIVARKKAAYANAKSTKQKDYIKQKRDEYRYAKRKLSASKSIGVRTSDHYKNMGRRSNVRHVLWAGMNFSVATIGGIANGSPLAGMALGALAVGAITAIRDGASYVGYKLNDKIIDAKSSKYNIPVLNERLHYKGQKRKG